MKVLNSSPVLLGQIETMIFRIIQNHRPAGPPADPQRIANANCLRWIWFGVGFWIWRCCACNPISVAYFLCQLNNFWRWVENFWRWILVLRWELVRGFCVDIFGADYPSQTCLRWVVQVFCPQD